MPNAIPIALEGGSSIQFVRLIECLVRLAQLRLHQIRIVEIAVWIAPANPAIACYTVTMLDTSRQAATSHDQYTLTIEEAAARYEHAGHPRTVRSIQRYCAKGHLDCLRQETPFGDKYLTTPESVARHIAQIEELSSATNRDMSRHVTSPVAAKKQTQEPEPDASTSRDMSRYVERLEREVEQAKDERDFLREQIDRKDKTIDSLIERDRETNILVRGLQEMLTPLLGPRRDQHPDHESTQRD